MMFELSGKDAGKFVENVGYGFASGFLISNNIQMPESALDAHATAAGGRGDGEEGGGDGAQRRERIAINPITGQRRDAEDLDTGPEMTMEEKEREAERMFVLFERYVVLLVLTLRLHLFPLFYSLSSNLLPNGVEADSFSYLDSKPRASWTSRTQSKKRFNPVALRNYRMIMKKKTVMMMMTMRRRRERRSNCFFC